MFSKVKMSNNYAFGDEVTHRVSRKRVKSYETHCLHTVLVIGKYTGIFQGGGYFSWMDFLQDSSYLCFFLAGNPIFQVEMLCRNCPGKGNSPQLEFSGDCFVGGEGGG